MQRTKRSSDFDVTLMHWGHRFRVMGTMDAGCPEAGPTHDCGGTPAEPPCLEDVRIFIVLGEREREISDPQGEILEEIEPTIWELLSDEGDR